MFLAIAELLRNVRWSARVESRRATLTKPAPAEEGPAAGNVASASADAASSEAVSERDERFYQAGRWEPPPGHVPTPVHVAARRALGGRMLRLAACESDRHLVDAIAADRARLERVNDGLRAQIAGLRAELAEARAKADA